MRTFLSLLLVCFAGQQQASADFGFSCYPELSIRERMASAEAAVVTEWMSGDKHPAEAILGDLPGRTTYKVVELIKAPSPKKTFERNGRTFLEQYQDGKLIKVKRIDLEKQAEIRLDTYEEGSPGDLVVLLLDPKELEWSDPIPVNPASLAYIKALPEQHDPLEKRLEFYLQHLESADELVAEDACLEFTRFPFEEIQRISEKLPREKLRQWVADKNTKADRLGLYGEMLGLCGDERHARLLEDIIKQPVKKNDFRPGIDGIMGGYLLLKGEEGLRTLEEMKLKPGANSHFSETYAAMNAVVFAWDYGDNIKKDRLKQSMRLLLENPNIADLAMHHLTRWKDWKVQDKVVKLYDTPAFNVPSYKRAIVTYLLTCSKDSAENGDGNPTQEHAMTAKKHLGTLRAKDPETVKKAERYFDMFNPKP